jgi:DNA-binding SARP family transcriptional activator
MSGVTSAGIYLLGKPALFVAGSLQPFGGPRKAIALLAYLILHRGRALSRAAVAEQFWPDEEDENARASLRRHLHRATSALPEAPPGRPWVIADKVTLRWNPDAALTIDTQAFEERSAAGELEAAVELYRGDYLDDFYDDWILPERERLRALQSANLVSLVDQRRRALDYPAAIRFAQSLLRLDPLREDAIRRLMSLRFAAGDRSGALADFETFSRRLHDELSTDPMPETLALHEAIRSNDHSTLESAPSESARVARPRFPFVGRAAALQTLQAAWEGAARGSAGTVIVSGEAGAGKSRLIGELMALAEAQGGRVMFGTTAVIETEPYQPVAEALRGALPLLRLDRLEPAKLAALCALVPSVRDRAPGVPQLPHLAPERDRQRLFDAVESAFEQIAEKRPLLVVLEDLHWAGAATMELLEFLARRMRTKSILLVVSFREEDAEGMHALRAPLRQLEHPRSSHIALGRLDVADVRALLASAAPEQSDALADDLFTASEGNALFLTELLRERLSDPQAGALPTGIVSTVIARLNRLAPASRSLVEIAAVAGAGFDAEIVRQVGGWSFAAVFDALDELLDRALVRASPQRRGEFSFSHQLVHSAVYASIDETARRWLHRRVGKTLEQLFSERVSLSATIARHFDAAGFAEEAVARYLPAVRHALDVFAQGDAIALATRALELCTDSRDRFELHRLREEAAARAGDGPARRRDCTSMQAIARAADDAELLGVALYREFMLSLQLGERDEAANAIAELSTLGERAGSVRWAVEAAVAEGRLHIDRSDHATAETVLARVEALLGALDPNESALAFEYWSERAFNAAWTDVPNARGFLEYAQRCIGTDRILAARALRIEAQIADIDGDARSLRRTATQMLEIYRDIGDLEGQATAHRNLASAAWYEFDVVANYEHTARALDLFERVQKPNAIAALYYHRGNSELILGDFEKARADLSQARDIWQSLSTPGNASSAMSSLACLASLHGDPDEARAFALDALALASENGLGREKANALDQLSVAEHALGMLDAAREHLEAAIAWRRDRDPRQVLEGLTELIPLSLDLGRVDAAVAAAGELLEALAEDPTRVSFPAIAVDVAAAAYAAAGRPERADELRAKARALLRELAARIADEPSRRGYLALRGHRAILGENATP